MILENLNLEIKEQKVMVKNKKQNYRRIKLRDINSKVPNEILIS